MGWTDDVSSGRTPIAFSISAQRHQLEPARPRFQPRGPRPHTSELAQSEPVDLVDLIGIQAIVLDDIDVVGAGQQPRKRRVARIPERRRDDAYHQSALHDLEQAWPRAGRRGT